MQKKFKCSLYTSPTPFHYAHVAPVSTKTYIPRNNSMILPTLNKKEFVMYISGIGF